MIPPQLPAASSRGVPAPARPRVNPSPGLKSLGGLGALQWEASEDLALMAAVEALGTADWTKVAQRVRGRTAQQCMSRWVKALKIGEEKGPWTEEEDGIIRAAVAAASGRPADVCWAEVAQKLPGRLGKQCRERWQNRLDPNISKTPFAPEVSVWECVCVCVLPCGVFLTFLTLTLYPPSPPLSTRTQLQHVRPHNRRTEPCLRPSASWGTSGVP
jgi:hypothetical protein